ncbi:MAG: trypsin-like peptidase domain-containing protein [Candidatus Solibacter sp.]
MGPGPLAEGGAQQAGFVADQRATGSGVIVDPDGYIVTNAHAVIDARHIDVSVIDGGQSGQRAKHKHFAATTVRLDRETDLAVLKIEAKDLPTLFFLDDSETLKQGQERNGKHPWWAQLMRETCLNCANPEALEEPGVLPVFRYQEVDYVEIEGEIK